MKELMAEPFKGGLRDEIRDVRRRYDQLPRGSTAPIRRCRTEEDVALEGTYWRIGGAVAHQRRHFAAVVLLFPLATHTAQESFSFGRYLRRQLGDNPGAVLRIRRLLDSRDWQELSHRLRAVLRLAFKERAPIDWGVLGDDILWFFSENNHVRRRWAQDFYAPAPREVALATTNNP